MNPVKNKQKILELFEQNRGIVLSGAKIADGLGVSRNAVWKAVNELKAGGYLIDGVPNCGYRFSEENDILSPEGIAPFLNDKSQAGLIQLYDSAESTNLIAKRLATQGAKAGTAVIAEAQSSGYGRYGRTFSSPRGGLYISCILNPPQLNPTVITAHAAVCVCNAIEAAAPWLSPKIKWVNDIFCNQKKVCGISTEAVTDFESGGLQWAVVGIGINVNTKQEDFPPELQDVAGSLCDGKKINRNRLAAELMNRIFIPPQNESGLFDTYKSRLFMLGRELTVTANGLSYAATALDIDSLGRLIVKKENGDLEKLSYGEVSLKCK